MIGTIEGVNTNKWGFTGYMIGGKWLNCDRKGITGFSRGDAVEYETYLAKGKYETIKADSLKAVVVPAVVLPPQISSQVVTLPGIRTPSAYQQKEAYWADKAENDAAKEPRIAYFAAFERAVAFVDLALRNGAFTAFAKAKDSAKLDILTAFVDEQALRIMSNSYYAEAPPPLVSKDPPPEQLQPPLNGKSEEIWE
jgi:hypothetical protein